ncbi:MAG: hypothetical protein IJC76_00470 [Lachnospiraceae bacterium]|nr:hypothetical protein [Lachnospiraceae bacterium]
MGGIDAVTKKYIRHNDKFADVCNYYLFNGESVIKAEELEDRDITELLTFKEKKNKMISVQKLRDTIKRCVVKTSKGISYMIIGIENQAEVHYAMVIRNMVYDALNYSAQVDERTRNNNEKKDLTGAEYISRFSKYGKLIPVITITVYWNSGSWDGMRSLHEMLDVEDKELLEYVPNYWLNLIVPGEIDDFNKFKTELGNVFKFIAYADNREEFEKNFLAKENIFLSKDAVELLNTCVNAEIEISEEVENNVCKAIQDIRKDERNIGREEGREEGEERLAKLVKKLTEENRYKDLADMLTDKQLRNRLYNEYNFV